jgi:hypothetical protein
VQKDEWLARLLLDEGAGVRREILGEFRRGRQAPASKPKERRSLADLRRLAAEEEQTREARETAARVAEQQRKAAERSRYLDGLVGQEKALWKEAEEQIETKKKPGYERAIEILKDLRDVAEKQGQQPAFQAQVLQLAQRHRTKGAFVKQMRGAGLA